MPIPKLTRAFLVLQRAYDNSTSTLESLRTQLIGWDTDNTTGVKVAVDASGRLKTSSVPLNENYAYDGSGNVTYAGFADPGAGEDEASWQILKYEWSGGNMVRKRYADDVSTFTKVWDSRASYTYSDIS